MNITALLDRPIAFYRSLANATSSVLGGLLLSQALYWQNRTSSEDGWWWKTQEEWTEETGMTRTEFESARRACRNFLKVKRRGIPAKCWYKVDDEALTEFFSNQDCRIPANWNAGNQQTGLRESCNLPYTETTSETTSERGARKRNFPVGSEQNPKPTKEQLVERFTNEAAKIPDDFKDRWNPSFEAEQFLAHFNSNGWRVGGKTPMLSWDQACVTWVGRFIVQSQNQKTRQTQMQMPPSKIMEALDKAIGNHICNPSHPRHHIAKGRGEIKETDIKGFLELQEKKRKLTTQIFKQI